MSVDFECQPHTSNKAISSIYNELLKSDDQLNRRPAYQRSPVWSEEQKGNLIDTVMTRCPMPIFLLYAYEDTNECIDGQNRLTTLKEYIEQSGENPWAWIKETNDLVEYIYYRDSKTEGPMTEFCETKTLKSRNKKKTYRLMTLQEVKKFNSYQCTISIIMTKLTYDQRKDIFLRWQSGTGISQCDRFKNLAHPFCIFSQEQDLERSLSSTICNMLKSGRNNWLWDLYRMVNLFKEESTTLEHVILSTINVRAKIPSETDLNQESLKDAVARCVKFLAKFEFLEECELYLSQLLCLGFTWKTANREIRDILENEDFMIGFIKEIQESTTIIKNTLNNGPAVKDVKASYNEFKQVLMSLVDEHRDKDNTRMARKRKETIPNSRKTEVWNTYIGVEKGQAKCVCCLVNTITSRSFHTGHVIPESDGGTIEVENLRPICADCNSSMGSKNMVSWMKKLHIKHRI